MLLPHVKDQPKFARLANKLEGTTHGEEMSFFLRFRRFLSALSEPLLLFDSYSITIPTEKGFTTIFVSHMFMFSIALRACRYRSGEKRCGDSFRPDLNNSNIKYGEGYLFVYG